jgi:hypothetical protein
MVAILDFEASSLSDDSYPIEVGWVLDDGSGEGMLIRPAPGWLEWDEAAAAIHGITRAELARDGVPYDQVCARIIGLFDAGHVLYASAPSWDGHWLSMLLRAAGRPRHLIRLRDTDELLIAAARARLGPGAADAEVAARIAEARACIETAPPAHRALADARREWAVWRDILER